MTEALLTKRKESPRVFFGWWTVLGGSLINIWLGGYVTYGFSALFKPIASELGLSRAITSTAASLIRLEGGIEGPIAGWATDRFGPKRVILLAIFIAGLGLTLMYYVNSLWSYLLVWGGIVGIGHNMKMLPFETAIANWFVKKRGLAMGIRWFLGGLSGVVILPFVAWLIIQQGWRMTLVIGGLVTWVMGLPIAWLCFKRYRPEYYGLLPDGATSKEEIAEASQTVDKGVEYAAEIGEVEFTLRQALRTPGYWLLVASFTSHGLVFPVISIHTVPFLTDIGMSPLQAAGMLSMLLFVGLPLRIIGGILSDRVKKDQIRWLLAASYFVQAIGFSVFLVNQSVTMIYVWFIVYGIGNGFAYGPQVPIWARYFGRKAFGSIRGSLQMISAPIGIIAPVYAGWVYDTSGSYMTVFTIVTAGLILATILVAAAAPPKAPARISDVRQTL